MSGDVALSADFSVLTKAKIDSVAVAGGCECPDVPKEKEFDFTLKFSAVESTVGERDFPV